MVTEPEISGSVTCVPPEAAPLEYRFYVMNFVL